MNRHDINIENIKKGLKNPSRVLDEIVLEYIYRAPMVALNAYNTIGTNVFEREWDMLVVLDTARVDALRMVSEEYDFINDVDSIWSVGGASAEWLARTFDEKHLDKIQNTAFLSAQNHLQQILDTKIHKKDTDRRLTFNTLQLMPSVSIDQLGKAEYLFKFETIGEEGPFGHKEGNTPPKYVTDRGIAVGRKNEFDRLILQYHQPHTPWFSKALSEGRDLKYHEYD